MYSIWVAPPTRRKGQRNYHILYKTGSRIARSLELESIYQEFTRDITITLATWAMEDHLFVLAGVVGWQGTAILIPGRSGAGRSELVAELIKAGATYYSDEMAVLDPQGLVHPYPVALSLHEENGDCKYTPDDFGAPTGAEPLPVGLILVTQYEEDAAWRPRQLTQGRALMALLENTVAIRRNPVAAIPILEKAVSGTPAFKTKRGEAKEVVPHIFELIDRNPQVQADN